MGCLGALRSWVVLQPGLDGLVQPHHERRHDSPRGLSHGDARGGVASAERQGAGGRAQGRSRPSARGVVAHNDAPLRDPPPRHKTSARRRPLGSRRQCLVPTSVSCARSGKRPAGWVELWRFLGIEWQPTRAPRKASSTRPTTENSNNVTLGRASGSGWRDVGAVVGAIVGVSLGWWEPPTRCPMSVPWALVRAARGAGHGSLRASAASVAAAHGR